MKKIMASIVLMMVTVVLAEPKFDDLVVKAKAGDAEAMCGWFVAEVRDDDV